MIPDLYDRKLGVGELLKASWRICKEKAQYLLLFAVGIRMAVLIFEYIVGTYLPTMKWLSVLLVFPAEMTAIFMVLSAVNGEVISRQILQESLKRNLASGFLVNALTTLFTWLLFIPSWLSVSTGLFGKSGVYITVVFVLTAFAFSTYLLFSLQALIVQKQRGINALLYSYRMVRGRWLEVFGKILSVGLIIGVPILIFGAVFGFIRAYLKFITPFFATFVDVYITILFLNIDMKGLCTRVDRFRHPVDPVIPSESLSS
jgi:hypothetical protein